MDTGILRHHGDEGARGKGTDTLPPATCHMIIIVDAALTLSEMNSYYFNSFWLIIKLETHCIKSLSLLSAEKKLIPFLVSSSVLCRLLSPGCIVRHRDPGVVNAVCKAKVAVSNPTIKCLDFLSGIKCSAMM